MLEETVLEPKPSQGHMPSTFVFEMAKDGKTTQRKLTILDQHIPEGLVNNLKK